MDVVRMVEELKDSVDVHLQNTDVFMAPVFIELATLAILAKRGAANSGQNIEFEAVEMHVNNMNLRFPRQLFVNGRFKNGRARQIASINPHDESIICLVESASAEDVDEAVKAAKLAYDEGEWSKISARERGAMLFKLVFLCLYLIYMSLFHSLKQKQLRNIILCLFKKF